MRLKKCIEAHRQKLLLEKNASSLNALQRIAMFRKDFCVDVDIVVFKVEIFRFSKYDSFCSKTPVI